jgi:hypothetical protein
VLPRMTRRGLEGLPHLCLPRSFRRCQHCLPCAADFGEAGSAPLDRSAQVPARCRGNGVVGMGRPIHGVGRSDSNIHCKPLQSRAARAAAQKAPRGAGTR